jgi:hypothetical protein
MPFLSEVAQLNQSPAGSRPGNIGPIYAHHSRRRYGEGKKQSNQSISEMLKPRDGAIQVWSCSHGIWTAALVIDIVPRLSPEGLRH